MRRRQRHQHALGICWSPPGDVRVERLHLRPAQRVLHWKQLGTGLIGGGKKPVARITIVAREVPNDVHATPQVVFPCCACLAARLSRRTVRGQPLSNRSGRPHSSAMNVRVRCAAALVSLSLAWAGTAAADQKDSRLDPLFAQLQGVSSLPEAQAIEAQIWMIWTEAKDGPTDTLMQLGMGAMQGGNLAGALELFDAV